MKTAVRDVVETLVLTLLIFLIVRSVVQNFKVDGRSMEPTLHTGQYLLIDKASFWRIDSQLASKLMPGAEAAGDATETKSHYFFGGPARGDIIVFQYPKEPSRDFIKRVIALPGDTVEIRDSRVYVNGQALREDYTAAAPNYQVPAEKVPAGNYFVLGDNRNNSSDSHIWGLVPEENIIGRAWLSYWPPEEAGVVGAQAPIGSTTPVGSR
jgi:signal peptidase I